MSNIVQGDERISKMFNECPQVSEDMSGKPTNF
jgi:hypothetical protein